MPFEMHSNGRSADQEFAPSEYLYRRFPPRHFPGGAENPIYAMEPFPVSLNRSHPNGNEEFVLYDVVNKRHYKKFGILRFRAIDVPREVIFGDGDGKADIDLQHTPLELNFYHSELEAKNHTSDGIVPFLDGTDDAIDFQQEWRASIRSILVVVKEPEQD